MDVGGPFIDKETSLDTGTFVSPRDSAIYVRMYGARTVGWFNVQGVIHYVCVYVCYMIWVGWRLVESCHDYKSLISFPGHLLDRQQVRFRRTGKCVNSKKGHFGMSSVERLSSWGSKRRTTTIGKGSRILSFVWRLSLFSEGLIGGSIGCGITA